MPIGHNELRRANEILRKHVLSLPKGRRHILRRRSEPELMAPRQMVMSFIDDHAKELGIEPICRELAVAPSSNPRTRRPAC